jgi:hypothetical protein
MTQKFREIFDGLRSAYGITTKTGQIRARDGKHETKNNIIRKEPTEDLYKKHIEGEEPALGIIPINENNLCKWGCIDIDKYDLNHKELIQKTKDLPTILFRSKSGGGHLFIFTKEWVPASLMRLKLKMIAAHIGHGGAEIYPKQDEKRSEKSVGNYLNLPYFGGELTTRYAFTEKAEAMPFAEFLEHYDSVALSKPELNDFEIKVKTKVKKKDEGDFEGIPPCLKTLLMNKVTEGGRNNVLFHLGVYLKKRFGDDWKNKMTMYNNKYFEPPLEFDEVSNTAESVESEEYKYKCKDEPMHAHCDPMACAMEKFGVGEGDLPSIAPSSIEKWDSDPPIYIVTIDGDEVECDDETLWNADKFGMACMNKTGKIMDPVGKLIWRKLLKKLFKDLQCTPAPESTKIDSVMKELFEKFASFAPGERLADVAMGKAYTEDNRTLFKWSDFYFYISRNGWDTKKMNSTKTQKMFIDLYNAADKQKKIGTKNFRLLEIDAQEITTPIIRDKKKEDASWKDRQEEQN